jgi:hypothetical protein
MNKNQLCKLLVAETQRLLNDAACTALTGIDHVQFEWHDAFARRIACTTIVQRGQSYQLSFYVALCHAQVELIHAAALGLSRRSYRIRPTLIGNMVPSLHYVDVENTADVQRWCAAVVAYLQGDGAQWFETPITEQALNSLFNATPDVELESCRYMLSRAEKGIIIAKLCDDPALPQLISTYRDMLAAGDIVLTFDDVVDFLHQRSLDELMMITEQDLG